MAKAKKQEKEMLIFMHYPPIIKQNLNKIGTNPFIKIMKKYDIKKCYYGHLHATAINDAVEGEYLGINFKLVSCDGLNFKLHKIN